MIGERKYLIEQLEKSGFKPSIVYTSMKKLKQANAAHLAAVLMEGEKFSRAKSSKSYVNDDGINMIRKKLYDKETQFKVIIGDTTYEGCEKVVNEFLINIGKGTFIDGNWSSVSVEDIDYVDEQDCILKSQLSAQFIVTFEGGLYTDIVAKKFNIGDLR